MAAADWPEVAGPPLGEQAGNTGHGLTDGDGDQDGTMVPSPADPLAVARYLIDADDLRDPDGVLTVRRWRGSFYFWAGTHFAEVDDDAVRARLYSALEHAHYLKPVRKDGETYLEPAKWAPNRHKIGDLVEALGSVVLLDATTDPPAWIEGDPGGRVVAVRNGLLDLDTRTLAGHTPRLFNLTSLPYSYDPANQGYIARWLGFLAELWPDDQACIDLLQEWFGYVLAGGTSMHKILLVVGPPRSGKGTLGRVLTALVGKANAAGPTLASLGTNFGLAPLLGTSLAVVSDARLGSETNTVVERLLTISGEDAVTVDRKYKPAWTGRLPTRFVLFSNELPNLGDASGAIASRFLVLTLTKTWLGKEDHGLTDDLLTELPGILGWSLDGLDRLRKQGHFTEPESSRDAVTALADLTSPVGAFVREACIREPGRHVTVRRLYQGWRFWAKEHGRDRTSTEQVFGRDLRAVIPGLKVTRPEVDGRKLGRHYEGLALTDDYISHMCKALCEQQPCTNHNASDRGLSRSEPPSEPSDRDRPRSEPLQSLHDEPTGEATADGSGRIFTTADDHAAAGHPGLNVDPWWSV